MIKNNSLVLILSTIILDTAKITLLFPKKVHQMTKRRIIGSQIVLKCPKNLPFPPFDYFTIDLITFKIVFLAINIFWVFFVFLD